MEWLRNSDCQSLLVFYIFNLSPGAAQWVFYTVVIEKGYEELKPQKVLISRPSETLEIAQVVHLKNVTAAPKTA